MELRQYLSIVWKWVWLIALAAGIAAVTSFFWNAHLPKIYQASTSLMVGQSLANPNPNSGDIFTSQELAQTYIQIAKTDPVLQGVINALKLNMSTDQLGNNVSANIIQGTQLIELRVLDTDPRRAQAIANEYAHQLIAQAPSPNDPTEVARRDFAQNQVQDIQGKIEDAQKKIIDLQNSIATATSARDIADKQGQVAALQTQINQWQITYATLLSTLAPRASNYLSVVEPARLPTSPIAPNVPTSVLLATAIGAALAAVGAFLIEYFDDTVKTSEDVTESLGLFSLGAIGHIWAQDPADRLIAAKFPRASHSEAYRALRTNIQVTNLDKPVKTLLISSTNPKEGKSITAANLAVVMALGGSRVLLVDADLRRPEQHEIFGLSNEFGLVSALLSPDAALDAYLQPTTTENLQVLTTGPLPPNPAELLDSARMQELIERLKERFDVVIFDTPPVLPRIDAAVLARHVDGVMLVVDAGRTRRDSAIRAKNSLAHAGGRLLGVVLNRISSHDSYYYYYYYSDSGKKKPTLLTTTPQGRAIRQLVQRFTNSKNGTTN